MASKFKYRKIDAFTVHGSLGNPAACIYLSAGQSLNKQEMLDIAKQHKGFVSEMVFCSREADNIKLTYFSSECEVEFCGHGTIACMYDLIKSTPELLSKNEIQIKTNKKGKLTVYNRIPKQDTVLITAPKPIYIGTDLNFEIIAQNLMLKSDDINLSYPIDLIDTGLRTLIVPLRVLESEISIYPDEQKLKEFCIENGIDIILIYTRQVSDSKHIAHTRVFAPKFGYLEDPATGSGNSAFGYYMLKNNLWDGGDCCIEQGGNNRIYNDVFLSLKDNAVLFGGSATLRIDGEYFI